MAGIHQQARRRHGQRRKIKLIEAEFKRLNVRAAIQTGAEHDCCFGRAQIFLEIAGADRSTPLILDPAPSKGSFGTALSRSKPWTTPPYNAWTPRPRIFTSRLRGSCWARRSTRPAS